MLPSLAQLSVNNTAVLPELPTEIWLNVLVSVINDELRDLRGAEPDWGRDMIYSNAKLLDSHFPNICPLNQGFRDLCASDPSIWAVIVERERDFMIYKLNKLQAQEATQRRSRYTFKPINDFLQLFLDETGSNLNNISRNLDRLEAMRLLVLMFWAPRWYRKFMWVDDEGEEEESEEDDDEEEFDEEFADIDDDELGPEGGGYPPED